MKTYVIQQRDDFFLPYEMYIQVRYLVEKMGGLEHIKRTDQEEKLFFERKIEGIINDILSIYLKKKSKEMDFDYWIDHEEIIKSESNKKRMEEVRKIQEEYFIEQEARKRLIEKEKEKIRKERGL